MRTTFRSAHKPGAGIPVHAYPSHSRLGYGASLMFGWTLLLVWAAMRPLERRVVAPLTMLVISGLIVTEITGVAFD